MKPKLAIVLLFLHRMGTIKLAFILIVAFRLNAIYCYDSESFETNRVEVTPFYDTIIYSDIADIINDFENNAAANAYDTFAHSESESEENIDDLLTEYQHYLDKAHKQRLNYMEKKTKNKVPPLRRDKYSKSKPNQDAKYNDLYYANNYYNPSAFKLSQTSFNNPLDVFIPINPKGKFMNKVELTTAVPKGIHEDIVPFEKIIYNDKKVLKLPPAMHKQSFDSIKSSCYCKSRQLPCECNCKQCIMPYEPFGRNHIEQFKLHSSDDQNSIMPNSLFYDNFGKEHFIDDGKDLSDNTLNIRIKVDLQFPKARDSIGKYFQLHNRDKTLERDDFNSKEIQSAINGPLPYFNLPIPMDLFGYKKMVKYSKHDSSPIHKITIHKKKKSKLNNNNKKHRKKVITFHNIKLEPQQVFPTHFAGHNNSDSNKKENVSKILLPKTVDFNYTQTESNMNANKTDEIVDIQTEENIYLMVNISSTTDNGTDESHKLENSIETDYTRIISNLTTKLPVSTRQKRAAINESSINNHFKQKKDAKLVYTTIPNAKSNSTKDKSNAKKSEKSIISDAELLYWPIVKNHTYTYAHSKNITTIILENEHKKSKLNMSKETLRHNHTGALEQAIFGDVDWDNVDAVAPAFLSFFGKYIRGVLTFCSKSACHSMKCASKTCIHRVCVPADRLNNKGHCVGSNTADSVASMESIMDLPSNIAFEIVDILQNKMLGKLFGKATLCINSKCITFAASKKNFIKSRCSVKELNTIGHCSNTKNVKIM